MTIIVQHAIENRLQCTIPEVLTRDQASVLVEKQKRAALMGKIIFEE